MTVRVYLDPLVITARGSRRAKYVTDTFPASKQWAITDYGLEPVCLLVMDVTDAEHTTMSGNADVTSLPADIDSQLAAGGVNATKNALEALNIPAGWVNAGMTYREILRSVSQIFQLAQRLHALGNTRIVPSGVTLNTQFSSLPQGYRQALQDAATSFGWDFSAIVANTTLRNILKTLSGQWSGGAITIGGFSF